jgi:predicted amidophosphoribosyltransferase
VGVHRGALRQAIVRYKYRGERWWADVFASMVGRYLDANFCWFEEFDLLAGVPTYTGPSGRRDWDPVGEILGRLEPALQPGWRVVPNAIVKVAETPGMQGRTWAERQRLAAGPIRQSLAVPDREAVAAMRVLVFDDVLTEGSTMREVARALRRAGAREVVGLVLARPAWTERAPKPARGESARRESAEGRAGA